MAERALAARHNSTAHSCEMSRNLAMQVIMHASYLRRSRLIEVALGSGGQQGHELAVESDEKRR